MRSELGSIGRVDVLDGPLPPDDGREGAGLPDDTTTVPPGVIGRATRLAGCARGAVGAASTAGTLPEFCPLLAVAIVMSLTSRAPPPAVGLVDELSSLMPKTFASFFHSGCRDLLSAVAESDGASCRGVVGAAVD